MRILIADLFSPIHLANLKSHGFEIHYDDKLNGESLKTVLSSFDPHVLVVRSTKVETAHFSSAKSLEAVIRAGSGYDNIEKSAANKNGVFVANCPGKNAIAVTELTFGLILAIDRKLINNDRDLKDNKWNKELYSNGKGLKGRTLGIIGYGNIGYEIGVRALAFDMNVLVVSIPRPEPTDSRIKVLDNLDDLLAASDVVTIHVPALPSTKNMVNKEFLNKMKKDATLLNTSRGTIIVEKDLIKHMNENPEFSCGLDVFLDEPKDKYAVYSNELAKHPRVVGTHHIGASTKQAEDAIGQEAYRMILEYEKSGVMPNCVNMDLESKSVSLRVKFNNTPQFFEGLFQVLAKFNLQVFECKSEVFEGGATGLAKLKVTENARKKEIYDELKLLNGLIDAKL